MIGRALVPHVDGVDLLSRPAAFRRIDVHLGFSLIKSHRNAIDVDAVHSQFYEVKPQVRCHRIHHFQLNGCVGVEELVTVIGHVQRQLVRVHIE